MQRGRTRCSGCFRTLPQQELDFVEVGNWMSEEKIKLNEGIKSILGQITVLEDESDWEAVMISEVGIDYCIVVINFEKSILINKHLFEEIKSDTSLGVRQEGGNLRIFSCPQGLKKNVN